MESEAVIVPAADERVLLQNGKATRLRSRANFWRKAHLVTGFFFAWWLVTMAFTGVLINHQADWNLDEIAVSNSYLPGRYTTEFSPESTRLNVIVADMHSGNFYWGLGSYLTDLVALLVLISVVSGIYAHYLRRKVVKLCLETCDLACKEMERSTAPVEAVPAETFAESSGQPIREEK